MAITPLQTEVQDFFNRLCCVAPIPPTVNYPIAPGGKFTFTEGTSVNLCPTTLSGDAPITLSINPSLPAGLSFNTSTGCITGTPTETSANTNYTVTATNGAGSDTDTFDIEIEAALVPLAPTIEYSKTIFAFNTTDSVNLCPSVLTGDATIVVSVSPSLPAGLTLNSSTGCITGTPTSLTSLNSFTFTATNSAGSDDYVMDIEVIQLFPIKILGGAFSTKQDGDSYIDGVLTSGTRVGSSFSVAGIYTFETTPGAEVDAGFLNSSIAIVSYEDLTGLISVYGDGCFSQSSATSIKIGNDVTFGDTSFEYCIASIEIGNNATFGIAAFRDTVDVTVGDNATFGANAFLINSGTTTIGDNATFGTTAFPNYAAFGSLNLKNFTAPSDNTFFNNFAGVLNVNFNGSIGSTTGDDSIFNPSFSSNQQGIINARTFDQTSNGGNVEGDLDFLINSGLTINFVL